MKPFEETANQGDPDGMDTLPGPKDLAPALMLTRRCNMTCSHCSVASNPRVKDAMPDAEVALLARRILEARPTAVLLTGGEPMLREDLALDLTRLFTRAGVAVAMTSNGFWGAAPEDATRRVRALKHAGLQLLTISYDAFHAPFLGADAVEHIAAACGEAGLTMNLNVTRTRSEDKLPECAAIARHHPHVRMRFYDVQPVGRAKAIPRGQLRSDTSGFCAAVERPAVTDDGRVIACNGPAYFEPASSPLVCGPAGAAPAPAFDRHRTDPYLEAIRTHGPAAMLETAARLLPPETFTPRPQYHGICDVCLHLAANTRVVEALRSHYARPEHVAEMAATRRVIEAKRTQVSNIARLNSRVLPSLLLRGMVSGPAALPRDSRTLFSRADVDWNLLLSLILDNGLYRPALPLLDHAVLGPWVPEFVSTTLQRQAARSALRHLTARKALRRVARKLDELGARSVLLKTPAITLFADSSDHVPSPGDLDLLILDGCAREVHRALQDDGIPLWPGTPGGPTPHHLPVLDVEGIPLEIHLRVGLPWLGLPEEDMLRNLLPLDGPVLRMRDEALFLHIVSHVGGHEFRRGLRTAWAAARILQQSAGFDWDFLRHLAAQFSSPGGFWAALEVFSRDLGLPVAPEFLAAKPRGRRQKRVDRIASMRLLPTDGVPEEAEPFLNPALVLLTQTNPWRPGAWREFLRLAAKEARFRRGTSRASLAPDASRRDLLRREVSRYQRTWRNIVRG